jgi:hypothetical protein
MRTVTGLFKTEITNRGFNSLFFCHVFVNGFVLKRKKNKGLQEIKLNCVLCNIFNPCLNNTNESF